MGHLQKWGLYGFFLKKWELFQWKGVPLVVKYGYDIPEAKGMLAVRTFVAVKRLFVSHMLTG